MIIDIWKQDLLKPPRQRKNGKRKNGKRKKGKRKKGKRKKGKGVVKSRLTRMNPVFISPSIDAAEMIRRVGKRSQTAPDRSPDDKSQGPQKTVPQKIDQPIIFLLTGWVPERKSALLAAVITSIVAASLTR
ncbi:MAG: hypothetical protein ACXIVE_15030 [Salinarimonas sp.]